MNRESDIVADILARAEAAARESLAQAGLAPEVVEGVVTRIRTQEIHIRRDWGGTEPYVSYRPRPGPEAKQAALEKARRTGKVVEAAREHGISRSEMYRMLKTRA